MRYTLLFIVCLFTASCTYRTIPVQDGKLLGVLPMRDGRVYYDFGNTIPKTSAQDIYRQSRRWVAFHLPDPKQALLLGDSQTFDIIGSGNTGLIKTDKNGFVLGYVEYAVTIEARQNSYRMGLGNFKLLLAPRTLTGEALEARTAIPLKKLRVLFEELDRTINVWVVSFDGFVTDQTKPITP